MATENHTEDRQSDLAVMEANEYKQKRRLERILDVVEDVEDKADEAWDLFVAGEVSRDGKNIIIQRAVQKAIREVYKLLVDHQTRADSHSEYFAGRKDEPIGTIEREENEDVTIYGLYDYMTLDMLHKETVTVTEHPPNKPPRQRTKSRETTVSEQISWTAYLRLKEFLDDEHDLEVSFEELDDELPNWGFKEYEEDEIPDDVEVI